MSFGEQTKILYFPAALVKDKPHGRQYCLVNMHLVSQKLPPLNLTLAFLKSPFNMFNLQVVSLSPRVNHAGGKGKSPLSSSFDLVSRLRRLLRVKYRLATMYETSLNKDDSSRFVTPTIIRLILQSTKTERFRRDQKGR